MKFDSNHPHRKILGLYCQRVAYCLSRTSGFVIFSCLLGSPWEMLILSPGAAFALQYSATYVFLVYLGIFNQIVYQQHNFDIFNWMLPHTFK
jgi:hypothetical protein